MADKVDRRVQRTRRALQEALIELILERGYESLTVQNITERANLGRATFYLHFRDKEELLFSTLETIYNDLTRQVDAVASISGVPTEPLSLVVFRHVQENNRLYSVMANERGSNLIANQIRDYLAAAIQRQLESKGMTNPGIPIEIVAYHLAGSLIALVSWWLKHQMSHSPESMAEMFQRLSLASIAAAVTT